MVVAFLILGSSSDKVFVNLGENNVSVSCRKDTDCKLIDTSLGLSCCWAGACDSLDYSKDSFIGVKKSSFDKIQRDNCPSPEQCGPAPGCPLAIKDNNFEAKCIASVCKKVPIDN